MLVSLFILSRSDSNRLWQAILAFISRIWTIGIMNSIVDINNYMFDIKNVFLDIKN